MGMGDLTIQIHSSPATMKSSSTVTKRLLVAESTEADLNKFDKQKEEINELGNDMLSVLRSRLIPKHLKFAAH